MKRRRLSLANDQINPRRETSRRSFRGCRSSDDRPDEGESEIAARKRVKFAGLEEDSSNFRDVDCCRHEVESTTHRSEKPKTSEYAFFRKLKEGPAHKFDSRPTHVEKNRSEKLESGRDHGRESYGIVHGSNKKLSPSRLEESFIHPKNVSFAHPIDKSSDKLDMIFAPASTTDPNIRRKEKYVDRRNNASGIRDSSDVFFQKRENLLHLLRNTSPEIDELYIKGQDFLPSLLSRMSENGDSNNIFKTRKMTQSRAADTMSKAINLNPEVDMVEFNEKPTEELIDVWVRTSQEYRQSTTSRSRSRESLHFTYYSPPAYGIIPWSETSEMDYSSSKNIRDILPYPGCDSALDSPEVGEPVCFDFLGNVEDLPYSNTKRAFHNGQHHPPLLLWDVAKDERDWIATYPLEDVDRDHLLPLSFLDTVSFNFQGNVEDFPESSTNGAFLSGRHHASLLQWNFAKDDRDWITTCPLEEANRIHLLSLSFGDTDHQLDFMGGCSGSGSDSLLALASIENCSSETRNELGFEDNLAATFNHRSIALSHSLRHSRLPEERGIHDYLSEVIYHLRPDEHEMDTFSPRHHCQGGKISSALHSSFGYNSSPKLLLPWDPPSEAKLSIENDLQLPQTEDVMSSPFPRKHGWMKLMEDTFKVSSSGCSQRGGIVEFPLFQFKI